MPAFFPDHLQHWLIIPINIQQDNDILGMLFGTQQMHKQINVHG